ncbi:hypothetical protein S83_017595 [Arachis hypogaea]
MTCLQKFQAQSDAPNSSLIFTTTIFFGIYLFIFLNLNPLITIKDTLPKRLLAFREYLIDTNQSKDSIYGFFELSHETFSLLS